MNLDHDLKTCENLIVGTSYKFTNSAYASHYTLGRDPLIFNSQDNACSYRGYGIGKYHGEYLDVIHIRPYLL